MRKHLVVLCIFSYLALGFYDLCTKQYRRGAAEIMLAGVNMLLLL